MTFNIPRKRMAALCALVGIGTTVFPIPAGDGWGIVEALGQPQPGGDSDAEPSRDPNAESEPGPQAEPQLEHEAERTATPEPQPPPATLTAAERAALKAEIKAELNAERMHAEAFASKDDISKWRKAPNPLVPQGQDAALGKHPVNDSKSTYKPGTGLHFESEDGAFAMATRVRAQLRHEFSWQEDGGKTLLEQVFQIRRARLQFKGHAFNKHNKYKIELAFSPRDLGVKDGVLHNTPLLTWYSEFDYLRDLTVRLGQYKIPFSRQRVTSSGDLQFVDRSIANGEFNHDRDIGFDIRSKDIGGLGGRFRYYAGVYMGEGRDFGGKNATTDFKLHYLGRLEVLPFGKFKDYKEADIERNLTPKLSIGGTYSFHHEAQQLRGTTGSVADDGGTTNYQSVAADYSFKLRGFSSNGEFHWREGSRKPGDATTEAPDDSTTMVPSPVTAARNGYGFHVQAGYVIPNTRFELAARYSGVRAVGVADPGDLIQAEGFTSITRTDAVGGGLSYYVAGHPWKIQADYFNTWKKGLIGEGENRVRVQLQLAL